MVSHVVRSHWFALALSALTACSGDAAPGLEHSAFTTDGSETLVVSTLLPGDPDQVSGFGAAVAVSGDLMAVAAPSSSFLGTSAAVYVFLRDRTSGQWVEQKKIALAGSSDEFELTLALDGETLAVGVPNEDLAHFQQGHVYVFQRDQDGADSWGEAARLTDAAVGDLGHFGASVAVSGDLVFVGATMPPNGGKVEIFQRDRGGAGRWGRVTTLSDSAIADGGTNEAFGSALAVDGDLLLVGASMADVSYLAENDGASYLFTRDSTDPDLWTYTARLTPPDATVCTGGLTVADLFTQPPEVIAEAERCAREDGLTDNDWFGSALALRDDTAAVGAPFTEGAEGSGSAGAVHLFKRGTDGTWTHTDKLQVPSEGYEYAGMAVALGQDSLLVGAHGTTVDGRGAQGAAYAYLRDPATGIWGEPEPLIAADGLSSEYFGRTVALDGANRVIGAYGRDGSLGAVYLDGDALPPPPPPPVCQPAFPTTDTLDSTGAVTSSSGLTLRAMAGGLSAPLQIWINDVGPPAEPLPDDATPLGGYFNVGAECTTFTPPRKQFLIGLPVPAGADTTRLAVEALVPASSMLDGPLSGSVWLQLDGIYDSNNNVFVIAAAALSSEGTTFILIETSAPALRATASLLPPKADMFEVLCDSDLPLCTDAEEQSVTDALLEAYNDYKGVGLPEPYLANWAGNVGKKPYRMKIVPSTDDICVDGGAGTPLAVTVSQYATIQFCFDPGGAVPPADELRGTARHELFHAFQYAYATVRDKPANRWLIEGTAEAAAGWNGAMARSPRALRPVDRSATDEGTTLETGELPYQMQDFWVHLFTSTDASGVRRNISLGELGSFFAYGGTTDAVAARMSGPGIEFDPLGDEYWRWAKNQVIEKTDVTFGVLTDPCQLESSLAGELIPLDYSAVIDRVDVDLDPLAARVVEIHIPNDPAAGLDNVTVRAEGGGDLAYKVYLDQDPLAPDCRNDIQDGERTLTHLSAGATLHVLVANKAYLPGLQPLRAQVIVSVGGQ